MASVKEFSIEEKLKLLVALQKIESKLDSIVMVRGQLPLQVKDLEDTIEGIKRRREDIEKEINGIQEYIVEKQEYIKKNDAEIKKYEKQSKNVKNNREFEALEKEIKFRDLEIKISDRHIMNAQKSLQEKSDELDSNKKKLAEKQFFLAQKSDELVAIIQETEKEEKTYTKQATATKAEIDETLVRSYEKIRKKYKNGLGIVAIVREACGGCFSSVPPQKQSEIKLRKNIIICENCGRILVDDILHNSVKIK